MTCDDNQLEFHVELDMKFVHILIAPFSRSEMRLLLSTSMPLMKTNPTGWGGQFLLIQVKFPFKIGFLRKPRGAMVTTMFFHSVNLRSRKKSFRFSVITGLIYGSSLDNKACFSVKTEFKKPVVSSFLVILIRDQRSTTSISMLMALDTCT